MGVSFKISKTGTKFKPKPIISDSSALNEASDNSLETSRIPPKIESNGKDDAVCPAGSSISSATNHNSAEDEISFVLNLYPEGYSIGKPSENDSGVHAAFSEGSKLMHPYDRTSEGLFLAIESGRLPGGMLDDIPCKFVDGTLCCEVRDYRKCISGAGSNITSVNGSAKISKVHLKMSLENVVKDIPTMADDSWTYGDLMEVESRILKALQPKLCLDPTPRLDRLCENSVSPKLNLGLVGKGKKRMRLPEVTVTSSNRPHGKKICIERAPESSSYRIRELGPTSGDMVMQHVQDSVSAQGTAPNNMLGSGNQRNMSNSTLGPTNVPGIPRTGQELPVSNAENMNSTASCKLENQEGPYPTFAKRTRIDGPQQQQIASYMDGLQGSDVQWRNQLVQHQNVRGLQYANPGMQKYPQLVSEGISTLDSIKLEKADTNLVKTDIPTMEADGSHMDPRQRYQQNSLMRPAFQQANWTNLTQLEKDPNQFGKRKSIQSPRLSAGAMAHSPLSAKSGEVSCGSMGGQYGAVSSAPFGQMQREKAVTSVPAVDRTTSLTSSANDSMQPHQAQLTAKRRSNSLSKNPAMTMSGVGSPASVNTVGGPMNASSPSVSTPQITEQIMIERFTKIEVVAMRHELNRKKNKVDEYSRKTRTYSAQELLVRLSNANNSDYVRDESCTRSLSQSLVGGNMNVCKIRVINVRLERTIQGNMVPVSPGARTRMIMSEKPNDGTIAMHYGDLSDDDYLNAEDYLPSLPNAHLADLLASQFCTLMIREGYMVEDHVQPRPPRSSMPSNSQPNVSGVTSNNPAVEMQQCPESASQQLNDTKPTIANASLNTSSVMPSSGMLSSGSSQALQASQGLVSGVSMPPRPQQMDPQQTSQQPQPQPQPQAQAQQQLPLQNQSSMMPQQQPQFPRAPLMLPTNSMPQLNSFGQSSSLPMGNHIGNKPNPMQLLQQQQQQQSQQVPQMQRRMMMGLGPTGMGMATIGNNMVGLRGLGNVMGIGGARGMGGTGISAPISGMGSNMAQNPISISQANAISQHIRAGTLTPQQAQAAMVQKLRLLHSRGMLGGNQSGVPGMSGAARQMQPGSTGLSMLGQTMNRGNINPMQQTAMGQMGMSKMMPGMSSPMNQQMQLQQQLQQQQQQQMQQQLQMQQQQQPQQQQMQQQEATSPLQAVVSPQQVGSPSTLGIPQPMGQQVTQQQQQASPQQIGQRTPMSPPLSSGPMHPMSAGNPEVCPASPALSSQTLGSVGSITNSPMDLPGVNKSNTNTVEIEHLK